MKRIKFSSKLPENRIKRQQIFHFSSLPPLIHTPYSSPAALLGPFSARRSGRKQLPTSCPLILSLNSPFSFAGEIFAVCCSVRVATMKVFRGKSFESAPVVKGCQLTETMPLGAGGRWTGRSGSSGQIKACVTTFTGSSV